MLRAEVSLAWKTQAGYRHQVEGLENEDAVFVTHEHPVFDAVLMVADGMGGHPRPREASEAAVRTARERLFDVRALGSAPTIPDLLRAAVQAAHTAVGRLWSGTNRRPGTTLSVAVVADGMLYVAHAGDGSVYLMREGQVRSVAGGEERRMGNRPAQFLGQEGALELEEREVPVAAGDRVLLCTDGLTRYFNEAGPEALERVLGREGVEVQTIASQLTAHSRAVEYDDDTTVAVAEVLGLTARRRGEGAPSAGEPSIEQRAAVLAGPEERVETEHTVAGQRGTVSLLGAAAMGLVVLAAAAAGFYAGRVTSPRPSRGKQDAQVSIRKPADEALARELPPGNLILLDELGKRVYALPTAGGGVGSGAVDLRAFKVQPSGRLAEAGRYRLDPARGTLTDPAGHVFPVDLTSAPGAVRVVRGGTLAVTSRARGVRVSIDGRPAGSTPLRLSLPEGSHRVLVEGEDWSNDSQIAVLAGQTVTLAVGPR